MEELKPCPFCGSKAHVVDYGTGVVIECESPDDHVAGVEAKTKAEAIMLWNRRSSNCANVASMKSL